MKPDIFDRLPRRTALLILAGAIQLTSAHAVQKLPRQTPQPTITVPYHVLNVASWPLSQQQPTPPPTADLFAYRRRQLDDTFNTICGYIDGDMALPATCGSGSHCVVDTDQNVVGCCPNGAPSCTAGVFTGCVDANSGPQTEVNPYVYSCTGSNVCYKNFFDGGFSQFGCGTASDQAATVQNSASGATAAVTPPTVSISYTKGISTLTEPTTLGTASKKHTSSTTHRSSSSSRSSSSTAAATTDTTTASADPASSTDPSAPPVTDTSYRTGAIVGGTIGGLAVAIALVALAFFMLRRRNANVRRGPGPGGARNKFISSPHATGGRSGFTPLTGEEHHDPSQDAFEAGPAGSVFNQPTPQQQREMQLANMAPSAATVAAAAAAGAAARNPLGSSGAGGPMADRSMLPPLSTHPPMPFQNEISPIDHHDLDTPFAYGNSVLNSTVAAAAATSAGGSNSAGGGLSAGDVSGLGSAGGGLSATAASVSSYPPSSSGGLSATGVTPVGNNANQGADAAAAAAYGGYNAAQGYNPTGAAYAGGSGLMMGMNPLLLKGGAERHLQSEQVPLTGPLGGGPMGGSGGAREIDDFSQGFHAALGRIGEEDEEEEERHQQQGAYRDHVPGAAAPATAAGGQGQQGQDAGAMGSEDSGGRPLWQQNRRQSRNMMWM
ncbi:uncharacterized protein C8A04DRAFT_11430 [Dichotomopilus funicola]|uniref:Uncharacterized protein n=1 Tax=Dichotomopilus funicola TaxID=1934379 RepID=A0AAN6V4E1_9PEZI|nr:hypothetical protein C8A04DRAFT_11430 [Dichotomopilus funicola]